MNILVFNCGSSSLNYKVFSSSSSKTLQPIAFGKAHRVGVKGTETSFIEHHFNGESKKQTLPINDHQGAAHLVIKYLKASKIQIDAIGHRFVHGGSYFKESTRLTEETYARLKECLPLASIHNPNSMSVIDVCRQVFPNLPEYVTFDTAFHAAIPEWAYTYALPLEFSEKHGLRKFGFHGLSYLYVTHKATEFVGKPLDSLKMIACHLGTGGSSIAAVKNGKSIDTSMGFSPLDGLIMSTRTGDLDPMVPLYLISEQGYKPQELDKLFNKQSGLLGISGFSSDIRDIIQQIDEDGDKRAKLAFQMYTYRLKQYIGAYAAALGGLDLLVFTDDIGVQSWQVREATCKDMEWCGIQLDLESNRNASFQAISMVSSSDSPVRVLSMPTNEELVIGMEGVRLLS